MVKVTLNLPKFFLINAHLVPQKRLWMHLPDNSQGGFA